MNMEQQELQTPAVLEQPPEGPSRRNRLRSGWKKLWKGKRKWLAVLLVIAIAGGAFLWQGRGQTAAAVTEYQVAAVERRSITNSLLQRHPGAGGLLHGEHLGLRGDPQRYL